ncbi:Probable transmembrane protein [Polaromonas sp. CG9_12]|nr:Probable transmembrane protein [Polaromonas sp. CG9_12]
MNTFLSTDDGRPPAADAGQEDPPRWRLTRRCALTPRQLLLSFAALAVFSATIALFFGWLGVWMIPVWCLVEISVAGALYLFYMVHAADGEQISFSPEGQLAIEVVRGLDTRHYQMNPVWARLERGGARQDRLWLCCSPLRIEVATQVGASEKRRVERELKLALAERRTGMGRMPDMPPSAQPVVIRS